MQNSDVLLSVHKNIYQVKTTWIIGKISLTPGQQKFWFEACENCQKAINVDVGWVMRCPSCKEESKVVAR